SSAKARLNTARTAGSSSTINTRDPVITTVTKSYYSKSSINKLPSIFECSISQMGEQALTLIKTTASARWGQMSPVPGPNLEYGGSVEALRLFFERVPPARTGCTGYDLPSQTDRRRESRHRVSAWRSTAIPWP